MLNNTISAFEYISILISLILGLGITQILSALADLLYHYGKVKFYWPHTLWVVFILFLHIQDWFITYQLKNKPVWHLPELIFILLYPVALFSVSKMLLPTNDKEENVNMRLFYKTQFRVIFLFMGISILLSILFNIFLLDSKPLSQWHLLLFMATLAFIAFTKNKKEWVHQSLAVSIAIGTLLSILLERNNWVIT
jgi:hypothetical protein